MSTLQRYSSIYTRSRHGSRITSPSGNECTSERATLLPAAPPSNDEGHHARILVGIARFGNEIPHTKLERTPYFRRVSRRTEHHDRCTRMTLFQQSQPIHSRYVEI